MLEIGVAISVATQSFNFLKSAFAAGRDIESMSGTLAGGSQPYQILSAEKRKLKDHHFIKNYLLPVL